MHGSLPDRSSFVLQFGVEFTPWRFARKDRKRLGLPKIQSQCSAVFSGKRVEGADLSCQFMA
jgi:hypothetical protein